METRKKTTFNVLWINIIFSLILTGAMDFKRPFDTERIIVVGTFYVVLLIVFPCLTYFCGVFNQWTDRQFQKIHDFFSFIKKNPKKVMKIILIYAGIVIISLLGELIYSHLRNTVFNEMVAASVMGVLYVPVTCYLMRKRSVLHPERLFLAIMIVIGSLVIIASPVTVGVSWDDFIHYQKAEVLPNQITGKRSEVDDILISESSWIGKRYVFAKDERKVENKKLNAAYQSGRIADGSDDPIGIDTIAFLPYDTGILIGRCFRFPFTVTIRLAKIINLITYALIIAAGAKRLKAGKMLILMLGMIPTAWFMSVNFSYDPWLISWTLYGFSSYLEFLQNKDKKMTGTDMIRIIGAYVIGCMPKAVYLILMIPLLFMPSRVFRNRKQHVKYITFVIIGACLLLGSFALPMLVKGAGTGDARGGSDVNSTKQIQLILSQPVWYIGMLSRFLLHYLSPVQAQGFLQNYAFYGMGKFGVLTTILYALVAVFDKNGEQSKRKSDAPIAIITFLLCMSAVASALYVSFTPVGLDTVNGCQYRYIIPGLALLLYMIVPDRIRNPIRKDIFINLPVFFVGETFLVNIMYCLIAFY